MIVEKHRGEIRCESKQGIGTSMTVRLPMHGETI
jgi:signal transduction histidine kinase